MQKTGVSYGHSIIHTHKVSPLWIIDINSIHEINSSWVSINFSDLVCMNEDQDVKKYYKFVVFDMPDSLQQMHQELNTSMLYMNKSLSFLVSTYINYLINVTCTMINDSYLASRIFHYKRWFEPVCLILRVVNWEFPE